ncbi:hypothetical protein OsI_19420 [Oryza sativa Indica Group]|uniref:Uncharacterized protein n=2 Tax=Oryza TaxID=4527 RepID=A0A0E0HCF8_ORYNI|nr:hypothetical protein OsI_19420 [Oryza sativa Indica Group]
MEVWMCSVDGSQGEVEASRKQAEVGGAAWREGGRRRHGGASHVARRRQAAARRGGRAGPSGGRDEVPCELRLGSMCRRRRGVAELRITE